jgi:hypothetical protein
MLRSSMGDGLRFDAVLSSRMSALRTKVARTEVLAVHGATSVTAFFSRGSLRAKTGKDKASCG